MKGFLQRILQEIMKKIMFGTSDAWLMSCLSQQPREPAYYIGDCRILFYCGSMQQRPLEFVHMLQREGRKSSRNFLFHDFLSFVLGKLDWSKGCVPFPPPDHFLLLSSICKIRNVLTPFRFPPLLHIPSTRTIRFAGMYFSPYPTSIHGE